MGFGPAQGSSSGGGGAATSLAAAAWPLTAATGLGAVPQINGPTDQDTLFRSSLAGNGTSFNIALRAKDAAIDGVTVGNAILQGGGQTAGNGAGATGGKITAYGALVGIPGYQAGGIDIDGGVAAGTNQAGASINFYAPSGTGNGAGSAFDFYVASPTNSGTGAQTRTLCLEIGDQIIRFGGTSASFPALRHSASPTTLLETRLADNSAAGTLGVLSMWLGGAGNYDVGIRRSAGGTLQIDDTGGNDRNLRAANITLSDTTGLTCTNAPGNDTPLVTADQTHSGASFTFLWLGASGSRDIALYRSGAGVCKFTDTGATNYATVGNGGVRLQAAGSVGWSSTSDATAAADVTLTRFGVGQVGVSNGVSGTTLLAFNTTDNSTSPINYERGYLTWSGNVFIVGTDAGGSGTSRAMSVLTSGATNLSFGVSGAAKWRVDGSTGHFYASTDNQNDLGATGANRPRDVYLAGLLKQYNSTTTAGNGLSPTVATARSVAQTALVNLITNFSTSGSDASYEISGNINVTAAATGLGMQVSYTDETNTARTLNLQFATLAGTFTSAPAATGPYEGVATRIRCKGGTSISVATTYTTGTYNAEVDIRWCK